MLFHTNEERNRDIGLLLARLALAAVFIVHGYMKWNDLSGTVAFFAGLGLPPTVAYVISAVELLGGFAMLLGILTKTFGILLAIVMLHAIMSVKLRLGFVGGFEFEFVLLFLSLAVAYAGAGKLSLPGLKRSSEVRIARENISQIADR